MWRLKLDLYRVFFPYLASWDEHSELPSISSQSVLLSWFNLSTTSGLMPTVFCRRLSNKLISNPSVPRSDKQVQQIKPERRPRPSRHLDKGGNTHDLTSQLWQCFLTYDERHHSALFSSFKSLPLLWVVHDVRLLNLKVSRCPCWQVTRGGNGNIKDVSVFAKTQPGWAVRRSARSRMHGAGEGGSSTLASEHGALPGGLRKTEMLVCIVSS